MKIQTLSFALAVSLSVVAMACSKVAGEAPTEESNPDAGEKHAAVVADAAVIPGQVFYDQNQCASCHEGEDAGPFGAPSLQDLDAGTLLAWMDGSAPHSGGTVDAVTTEDAENLANYLASED